MQRTSIVCYASLLLVLCSCLFVAADEEVQDKKDLDFAVVRAAIVKLAESSDEPALKVSLQNFKSTPFQVGKNGWATAGFYSVHVKKRKFVATFASPDLFEQFEGIFVQQKNGTWVAKITGVTRT